MARRVFLHIGTMKSATTYVQGLGHLNRARLAAAGVRWPDRDMPLPALADLMGRAEQRPGQDGAWARLMRQFDDFPGDAVFSNELLAALGRSKIRRLVAAFGSADLQVVITARDLGRVIPSHWQTTLKGGSTTPWSDFAAAVCREPVAAGGGGGSKDIGTWFWRRHDLAAIVARWQEFVPPERVTLVTVPPPGRDSRLVGERFAAALGVSAGGFEQPPYDNSSLGAHSAELVRRMNAASPDLQRHHFRWGSKHALTKLAWAGRSAQEPSYGLTKVERNWVCERAERMIGETRAAGVRVVGDLDELRPAPKVSTELVDPAATSEGALLAAALAGLGGMVKVVGDMCEEQVERALVPPAADRD